MPSSAESAASGNESRRVAPYMRVRAGRSAGSAARATMSAATLRTAASRCASSGRAAASSAGVGPVDLAAPRLEARGNDPPIPVGEERRRRPRSRDGRALGRGGTLPPILARPPARRGRYRTPRYRSRARETSAARRSAKLPFPAATRPQRRTASAPPSSPSVSAASPARRAAGRPAAQDQRSRERRVAIAGERADGVDADRRTGVVRGAHQRVATADRASSRCPRRRG